MPEIYLYNTLGRKKEKFVPVVEGQASLYYCGPTVYWTQHIGNLRGSFCADTTARFLRYAGYDVKMVRNYTDVGHLTSDEDEGEDKLEKGAKREGLSPAEIAQKYIDVYEQDARDLNVTDPNFKPRATECVPEMIEMVQALLEKGYAYNTDLAIYFDTSKAKDYHALSGQIADKNLAGSGSGDVSDSSKRHPADFALWFYRAGAHQNALQYWPSPFMSPLVENGNGFPGWHIECSAMSKKFLGATIDIHMGGIEHVPVHHTNEIAQSEAANGVKFANYWVHNGHLMVDDGKMSKSQGTGYSLAEIKERGFDPLALRFFFLQAHYRSKQNFTWEAMAAAQNGYNHLKNQLRSLSVMRYALRDENIDADFKNRFLDIMGDDLNTPQALALAQEVLKSDLADEVKLATVLDFDKVFGLKLDAVSEEELPEDIADLVSRRKAARAEKNWAESDRLRDEMILKGFVVEDGSEGMRVFRK